MSVIADANGVHGIGGIMGGEGTGCTEETTNVFLEVARFDPIRTATTGRKLGIESDARYRFERGLDPESAYWGAEVATRLILEFCGGEASELTIAGEMPDWATAGVAAPGAPQVIRRRRCRKALSILDRLGFKPEQDNDLIKATTPSWRADVSTEYCLIEEVLRVKGFDEIPAVPMERETSLPNPAIGVPQRRAAFAKRTLAQRGMMEAVTWSFMPGSDVDLFGGIGDDLRLANPISADLDVMRPSILPNLVAAAKRNADRGYPDAGLFEVGPAYRDDSPSGQDAVAAGLRHGNLARAIGATSPPQPACSMPRPTSAPCLHPWGRPSTTCRSMPKHPHGITRADPGTLRLGKAVLAYFGEIHPRILRRISDRGPAAGFEVFLDRVPQPKQKGGKARPHSRHPHSSQSTATSRSLWIETWVGNKSCAPARSADRELIADAGVFDIYEGEALGRQEVRCDLADPATSRAHAHRRRNRGRGDQDRR